MFFTYLYATTTLLLPLVKNKAILVPTAHDEKPIHSAFYDDFLSLPRSLVYSTPEEKHFLTKRTNGNLPDGEIIGVGINVPENINGDEFKKLYNISSEYFLYVGRIQKEKNCHDLFDSYLALPEEIQKKYKLILIGNATIDIPYSDNIRYLGFVSDEMKFNAISSAKLMIMPSQYESLNMSIMESWLCEVPVLVNGKSDVLVQQCIRSNGGLWYNDQYEFEAAIKYLID